MVEIGKNYTAIVLVAGIGKRINSFTLKPKSLLKYKKEKIIDYIIQNLIKLGIKNFYFVVGYKSKQIKLYLKKYKEKINLIYVYAKNYYKYGSAVSWSSIEKHWKKRKTKILMLHGDLVFNNRLTKEIILEKKRDIIGSVIKTNNSIKNEGFVLEIDEKRRVLSIDHKKNYKKKFNREIACINKFSVSTQIEIFKFMKKYFNRVSKEHTWEYVINKFISSGKNKLYTNTSKKYNWHNINTKEDYLKLNN